MSIWTKIFGGSQPVEAKDYSLADPAALALFGIPASLSGVAVGEGVAMQQSTAGACLRLISNTLGSLPVHVFQKDEAGERDRASQHPADRLLGGFVAPWQASSEFLQLMTFAALVDGRAYAKVTRIRGEVREILMLPRGAVRREVDEGTLEPHYFIRLKAGGEQRMSYQDVIELCPFGGRSPLRDAASAIGLAVVLEQHGSSLFKNGARPSGVLKIPGRLTDVAAKRISDAWHSSFGGTNSGKTAIIEEGGSFEALALTSTDSQYNELRQTQVSEICRAFGVPEVLVSSLSRGTWRNIEELNRVFLQTTVLPWVQAWEAALERSVLTPAERAAGLYVEMSTAGLERGDTASRFAAYSVARTAGIMTANEVRRLENLPAHPEGNTLANPNTTPGAPGSTEGADDGDDKAQE
ncbi:phage portal protein [Mesorhizobium sp. LHD-90]|uniref:phage portal protein n=1 Tax=Mesorhizobium sp. LHD-90 TaxID=3071414 RepID=UPI0027DEF756|nr:phage portal protein [Mesorhizobium sp. LHD-90]MDQ6434378.1 phage portal protein [Mesorhizobium sp. LHD-90]